LKFRIGVQSVKHPTLDFSSGHDLGVMGSSPALGSTQGLFVLLPPVLPPPLNKSINKILKKKKKFKIKIFRSKRS